MARICCPLELPDDVLMYRGTEFFDLVNKNCGEIVKELMKRLSIDSVRTLLDIEEDIFMFLQGNCNTLNDIKEKACLYLEDGTVMIKPGLRFDFDRFIEALRRNNNQTRVLNSTSSSSTNNFSMPGTQASFRVFEESDDSFLKKFINNIEFNQKRSKNNYRYSESVQTFAQALYIMSGRNAYEFIRLNLLGALPSITSVENYLSLFGGNINEGEFRYDVLRQIQTSNNCQYAICSEDCTDVMRRVKYNASSNTFIGFSTPLEHGIPLPRSFQTDSYEQLKQWFENREKSNLLNVHMLELLTGTKSSSPFLLGAYGITSKFDSTDVLRRWMWIFEQCRLSNIRILAFSTDCDPKYLRAMRLVTGFFATLPNIPIVGRSDAFKVKIPKSWSNWFFMRTTQLFFCFQDPVHMCTKIRNRLLSSSASIIIGDGKASISVLLDLISSQSKLIHGLVKTDVQPKDRQNFGSCIKISSDDVLLALRDISGSYATQVYLRLMRSIILAYIETNTSIVDRVYYSWISVFICRLWWTWLNLTDISSISTTTENRRDMFFITTAAYHSIEINAHTLLSVILLVCQNDLPESVLSIPRFNSQTCENVFRLTRSMSGTFSSNVNFTVDQFLKRAGKLSVLQDIERRCGADSADCSLQFPKHHKKRHNIISKLLNSVRVSSDGLTQSTIEKTIRRAFDDAYKMLSTLNIDKTLIKARANTIGEVGSFVHAHLEQRCHTSDYSNNWNEYSDDESDIETDDISSNSFLNTDSSSDDEIDDLLTNSSYQKSQFEGIRIFDEIPLSQTNSFFRINVDIQEKYMHKQTACWLLTDEKASLSTDRLQRVQQMNRT